MPTSSSRDPREAVLRLRSARPARPGQRREGGEGRWRRRSEPSPGRRSGPAVRSPEGPARLGPARRQVRAAPRCGFPGQHPSLGSGASGRAPRGGTGLVWRGPHWRVEGVGTPCPSPSQRFGGRCGGQSPRGGCSPFWEGEAPSQLRGARGRRPRGLPQGGERAKLAPKKAMLLLKKPVLPPESRVSFPKSQASPRKQCLFPNMPYVSCPKIHASLQKRHFPKNLAFPQKNYMFSLKATIP